MNELRVADSLTEIFNLFKRCNKYIDETEPWVLAKDEAKKGRLATVLYNLTESIVIGASLLAPFMPETGKLISENLNTELRDFDTLGEFGKYPNGNKVSSEPKMLFARKDMEEVLKLTAEITRKQKAEFIESQTKAAENLEKAGRAQDAEKIRQNLKEITGENGNADAESGDAIHVELKDQITYDDFAKCQFVVGEIVKCEEVPKSKKLLCSQVKIGDTTKQILSGIKAWYSPEQMVGKKVMVLLNLKPAKMAGLDSEGMLLCAEDSNGNVVLMTPETSVESGSEIG
jgi:methionyl-tRNA synthetase